MNAITLTEEQLDLIATDMDDAAEMLTEGQMIAVARKVSETIELPSLSKESEFMVLCKLVRWIDRELYQLLPNEYYGYVHYEDEGVTVDEAETMKNRLVPLVSEVIDIPYVSEEIEATLLYRIVGFLTDAMVIGSQLEEENIEE